MMTLKPYYAVAAAPGAFRSTRRNATPVTLEGNALA